MADSAPWHWTSLSRGQAFAIHLVLSLIAFSSLVIMMVLYWFPGELFFLDGGWQGLKLVAMVDLILGPALTLILFKPGKPKLLQDLSFVAAFQIFALGYGFVTTWQQRTVAVVHAENAFVTLSNNSYRAASAELEALNLTPQPIKGAGALRAPLLLTPPPSAADYGAYLTNLMNGYPEPHERSDQFVSVAEHHDQLQASALDADMLDTQGMTEPVNEALASLGRSRDEVEFYRFRARYASGVAIFDPTISQIIDYVPFSHTATPVTTAESQSD